MMARRRIGQDVMGFAQGGRKATGLDELATVIDWIPLEVKFSGIYAAGTGALGWPPMALFRALLLG